MFAETTPSDLNKQILERDHQAPFSLGWQPPGKGGKLQVLPIATRIFCNIAASAKSTVTWVTSRSPRPEGWTVLSRGISEGRMSGGRHLLSLASRGKCTLQAPQRGQGQSYAPGLACKHPGGTSNIPVARREGSANFSYKEPHRKGFRFVSCVFPVATTQFCHCSSQTVPDK